MTSKYTIIDNLIATEGGYVNDPSDSGRETKFGITVAQARSWGYVRPMSDLPIEFAFEIYSTKYWGRLRLDAVSTLSCELAEELMDTGVNCGVTRASEYLQRSLNVLNNTQNLYRDLKVDGIVGDRTVWALTKYVSARSVDGVKVLLRMLNSMQGSHYITLAERREKDEKFIFGWFLNRVK